jgi:dipeptidyl aminopeptidase/acylaminoacyl peptidase
MRRSFGMRVLIAACFLMILSTACAGARAQGSTAQRGAAALAAPDEKPAVHVERWLLLGPFPAPLPAFAAESGERYGSSKLLSYEETPLAGLRPVEGAARALLLGEKAAWIGAAADTNGVVIAVDSGASAIAYLASYVEVPRWTKIGVSARSSAAFSITIDGLEIMKNERGGLFKERKSGEAKLERGKHLLLVKTVHMAGDTSAADWRIDVNVSSEGKSAAPPALSLSSERSLSMNEILYLQQISGTAISPDGSLIAFTTGKYSRTNEKYQSWIEIRNVRDGSLARTIRDVEKMSSLRWAPVGRRLSYRISGDKDSGTLRVIDFDTGDCGTILENVKNLGDYIWGRDGSFMVYTVSEKAEPDKRGVRHMTNIEDRQKGSGDRSFLYITTVPGCQTRRLTSGTRNTVIRDTHPDCRRILISRSYEDLSQRPYEASELLIMNLEDQSVELLWKGAWLNDASFSPDGRKVLVKAGPSTFGALGVKVSEGTIPNDYDGQLYLFDIATKAVEPLTRDFDPAVKDAVWSKVDGNIYITAEDRSNEGLFRFNPKKKTFARIETGFEVGGSGDIASDKLVAAYVGSGATQSPRLHAIDLARGTSRMIYDPNAEEFAGVVQGAVEQWSFTSSSGRTIEGYYYLPPGFDAQKKYPCIVYYYGGTSPTDRSYGGRYPRNLWAAEGYVVYVLQPSGATGFGQEFSAYHVNDWGKVVAEEIIEGTEKFVEAHPFVDGSRLGCIGASYGGFLTELLVTKTDIFAAAVSHAGISSIASYWGEGYWGYSYNAVAAANSFPWNRRDIYVDQSPLFNADKIKTPLLLLHGAEDTNVPPGESEQMFTALKLLGKNVEYVQVEGQNHAVMDYKKRDIWSKTIIAWFDRYLKNEPEWWSDLYPGADDGTKEGREDAPAQPGAPAAEPADIGVKVIEKPDGSKVVLGKVTREAIISNIAGWDASYFEYEADETILGELGGRLDGISIVVVLGTWCSDSHEQVPRLWKVLDAIGFPSESLKTFAVERAKAAADSVLGQGLVDWSKNAREYYGVKAVESIIVYRGGTELGRIVEAPAKSIEADLLEILRR